MYRIFFLIAALMLATSASAQTLYHDYTSDGCVTTADYTSFIDEFQNGCSGTCFHDVTGDGNVTTVDYTSFLSEFKETCNGLPNLSGYTLNFTLGSPSWPSTNSVCYAANETQLNACVANDNTRVVVTNDLPLVTLTIPSSNIDLEMDDSIGIASLTTTLGETNISISGGNVLGTLDIRSDNVIVRDVHVYGAGGVAMKVRTAASGVAVYNSTLDGTFDLDIASDVLLHNSETEGVNTSKSNRVAIIGNLIQGFLIGAEASDDLFAADNQIEVDTTLSPIQAVDAASPNLGCSGLTNHEYLDNAIYNANSSPIRDVLIQEGFDSPPEYCPDVDDFTITDNQAFRSGPSSFVVTNYGATNVTTSGNTVSSYTTPPAFLGGADH